MTLNRFRPVLPVVCTALVLTISNFIFAQTQTSSANAQPAPLTADEDRQKMMDQLGITALRPSASGDEKAPDHANYDESQANPFRNVPDPLMHEEWAEGHDAGDVVEAAASGDR